MTTAPAPRAALGFDTGPSAEGSGTVTRGRSKRHGPGAGSPFPARPGRTLIFPPGPGSPLVHVLWHLAFTARRHLRRPHRGRRSE